ncbi:MAG: hypothetical protein ACTSQA_09475 [Candidatus Heimdallarchaeaceae archaeon]
MNNYKPLDNIINNTKNYIQNNSEKIWKGVKYGVILPTALAVSLSVAPNIQNAIHKFIPIVSSNISQVVAAELEKPYQIFENQIDAIKYTNENMWNMAQEKVFNEDPKFKEFEEKFNGFLNYPNPNHKLLMDLDKLESIKLVPDGTDGSYNTVLYVEDLNPKNAIKTGEIFNIPDGIDTEQYMNSLLRDVFYFNKEYQKLINKRNADIPKETVEDKNQ